MIIISSSSIVIVNNIIIVVASNSRSVDKAPTCLCLSTSWPWPDDVCNQTINWFPEFHDPKSQFSKELKILSKHLAKNKPFKKQAVYHHLPTGPHLWAEPSAWNWSNPILTPIHPATKDLPVARNAWVSLPVASCIRACHTSNSVTVGQQHGIT